MKNANLSMHHLLEHINQDIKRDKAAVHKTIPEQKKSNRQIQVSLTTAKVSGPYHLDKSLSGNCHRVWSPTYTHRRAINEESKYVNIDWVDHQAYSLLQYIML